MELGSKSSVTTELYIKHCRCKKAGYLHKNQKTLDLVNARTDSDQQHFRKLCYDLIHVEEAREGVEIQFEKTLVNKEENITIRPDIIINDSGKYILGKFKYSTYRTSDDDLQELAFIAYMLKYFEITISQFWIFYINADYVKGESHNREYLKVECTYNKVIHRMYKVPFYLKELQKTLKKREAPQESLNWRCVKPKCQFLNHCYPFAKSSLNLTEMTWNKKLKMSWKDAIDLSNIPDDVNFSRAQWREIDMLTSDDIHIEDSKIKSHLSILKSAKEAIYLVMTGLHTHIPLYDGSKPYNILFFHYCFVYNRLGNKSQTSTFEMLNPFPLNIEKTKEFFERFLIEISVNKSAPIVIYDKKRTVEAFESILKLLPAKEAEINDIKSRLVDLHVIFAERWYFNPKLNGSTQLEDVISDLSPELNWKDLQNNDTRNLRLDFVYSKQFPESENEKLKKIYRLLASGLMRATWNFVETKIENYSLKTQKKAKH